jgi:hypothetical protein
MWKQQSIQGDGVAESLSLYYTRSEDGGRTFSEAALLVEEPVSWREMVSDPEGVLHLLWRPENATSTVWDQVSLDGGRSWQFPQGLPDPGTTAALMVDAVGRLHFVDAGQDSLRHWLWDGSRWRAEPSLPWSLESDQEGPVALLGGTINQQGEMLVLLGARPVEAGNDMERVLLYSTRTLDTSPKETVTEDVSVQTPLPPTATPEAVTPESLVTPSSTSDSESVNAQGQVDSSGTGGRIPPLAIALVPVALLLLGVLSRVFRRAAGAEDQ